MTTKKAGADAGNNALKLWVQDQDPVMIPTSYALYIGESSDQFAEEQEDIPADQLNNHIDVTITSAAIETNGMRHIIGKKVLTDNLASTELEKKSDKSKDSIPVLVTLAGLATAAMSENPTKDTLRVNYDLAVALPIATITPDNAKAHAERFIGTHKVIYHHPSGRNVTVHITIEFAKTLPEGAAGAWGIVFNDAGKLTKRQITVNDQVVETTLEDKTILTYDIGAGTIEKVITKGVKYNPKLSSGLQYGSKETLMRVREIWNYENKNNTIDSMVEFDEIFFNPEHPRHNKLVSLARPALLQLSNQISTDMINTIDGLKDEPYVYVFGGGAAVLKDTLSQTLENKGRLSRVSFSKQPLYQNAWGLLVYTLSPRYQELKDKELGVTHGAEE